MSDYALVISIHNDVNMNSTGKLLASTRAQLRKQDIYEVTGDSTVIAIES